MSRQLSFDLPALPAMGRDDFFVSRSNAAAVAMIEGWQDWPARKLALIGPKGAGKTHLVHVWAGLSGGRIVAAETLGAADIPALAETHVAVEDAQDVAGRADVEEALFHLHNLALADGRSVLLTASGAPQHWGLRLPDLASRMEGTPSVHIAEPDDALLAAILMKLFADRQLRPTPETIPYLVPRLPRAFAAAHAIVDMLDRLALDQSKPINRRLAAEALDNLAN